MGISSRWSGLLPADLPARLWNVTKRNWHLGVTAFGGPPVHFKIFHEKFVQKLEWIDEQVYQELFSLAQALSGPASTKLLYCINLYCEGTLPAVLVFFLWSLPGAIGMFALSIGVSNIGEKLPLPAYALLSGLNAATVGLIALAAVQLSDKAITDKMTRSLVFFGAAAGMLYNALWYFPVLIGVAGLSTVVYDYRWFHRPLRAVKRVVTRPFSNTQTQSRDLEVQDGNDLQTRAGSQSTGSPPMVVSTTAPGSHRANRTATPTASRPSTAATSDLDSHGDNVHPVQPSEHDEPRVVPRDRRLNMSWKTAVAVIICFFLSFTVVMVLRGVLPHDDISSPHNATLLYRLFSNMYLAGTIIFGGGPVVIPLLREYVVAEGWVSPRDFLIGLALIQSFPGPNFNFAVFLGSLTAINGGFPAFSGALIAYIGIFVPGMVIAHGCVGLWTVLRGARLVKSVLRGFNAAAVGLIYTAVYRLLQIGWIDEGREQGVSLTSDPWWVVVIATSYVGSCWYGLSPPVAILLGGMLGLVRYGIVST
ncbi:chromate transporter-domain-containing protein [Microdochium trichocladiopsis]|uniref:Chromate transporter-domain-containing protein n=1 Tax=Microdochium trichocladiopsis TaxID=1682393 RepID=A0A9P8XU24_9PEZI|nr:chromate transporter-domain-containing protein [Microdochium trichocladiopsis]KAH7018365.1 chromate transporter-domain-containing protein [Microdochium trichocladiopsis]